MDTTESLLAEANANAGAGVPPGAASESAAAGQAPTAVPTTEELWTEAMRTPAPAPDPGTAAGAPLLPSHVTLTGPAVTPEPAPAGPSQGQRLAAGTVRTALPLAGAALGAVSPVPGGAALGAAGGAALAAPIARAIAGEPQEWRDPLISGGEGLLFGAVGAPALANAGPVLRTGARALQATVTSLGATVLDTLLREGRVPTVDELKAAAALGGVAGAVGGAVEAAVRPALPTPIAPTTYADEQLHPGGVAPQVLGAHLQAPGAVGAPPFLAQRLAALKAPYQQQFDDVVSGAQHLGLALPVDSPQADTLRQMALALRARQPPARALPIVSNLLERLAPEKPPPPSTVLGPNGVPVAATAAVPVPRAPVSYGELEDLYQRLSAAVPPGAGGDAYADAQALRGALRDTQQTLLGDAPVLQGAFARARADWKTVVAPAETVVDRLLGAHDPETAAGLAMSKPSLFAQARALLGANSPGDVLLRQAVVQRVLTQAKLRAGIDPAGVMDSGDQTKFMAAAAAEWRKVPPTIRQAVGPNADLVFNQLGKAAAASQGPHGFGALAIHGILRVGALVGGEHLGGAAGAIGGFAVERALEKLLTRLTPTPSGAALLARSLATRLATPAGQATVAAMRRLPVFATLAGAAAATAPAASGQGG